VVAARWRELHADEALDLDALLRAVRARGVRRVLADLALGGWLAARCGWRRDSRIGP
jgi:hypothetical protein